MQLKGAATVVSAVMVLQTRWNRNSVGQGEASNRHVMEPTRASEVRNA